MKFKVLLIFFLLGIILTITGALFKLMYWPFGEFILITAMLFQAFAIIMLIVKIFKNKSIKDFLNK